MRNNDKCARINFQTRVSSFPYLERFSRGPQHHKSGTKHKRSSLQNPNWEKYENITREGWYETKGNLR